MITSHWIILPILIPAIFAAIIILLGRFDIFLLRVFSIMSSLSLIGVSLILFYLSASGRVEVYSIGSWAAPYGIVLVLDRLSALMVGLTSMLGFGVLIYSIKGWDLKGKHFHTLFQFQLMGINGAFLTGDLFNLFVFFEILLIASYGLMVHGGGVHRIRAGIQYIIINLIGSAFFLIAAGLIYSVVGTLNMADLAVKVSQVAPGVMAILNTGAILLLLVFSIKSAIVPLHFWLPATYSNAPAPVAALFAILTKVGAYCILRVYILIFPEVASNWVLYGALATLIIGALGVLAAKSLTKLVSFYLISSLGTLLVAVGQFNHISLEAGLYYLIHSTFIGALLFLTVDQVSRFRSLGVVGDLNTGEEESVAIDVTSDTDKIQSGKPFIHMGLLSLVFFIAVIAASGLPPLSGFLGKIMILKSSFSHPQATLIWTTILITSLLTLIGFARAGSVVFWKSTQAHLDTQHLQKPHNNHVPSLQLVPLGILFSGVLFLTLFAGPASDYISKVADQMVDTKIYIEAVLEKPGVNL